MNLFRSTPPVAESGEWKRVLFRMVGGLTDVGFSSDEGLLLVVSHDGRGLFETATGNRLERDDEAPVVGAPWFRPESRLVQGIGSAATEWFRVAGLLGGSLRQESRGRWRISLDDGKVTKVFLEDAPQRKKWLVGTAVTEVKAVGFSESGRFLVVAASSEVEVLAHET